MGKITKALIITKKRLLSIELSIFGNADGHIEVEAAEKQRLKEDNALPHYTKDNRTVIPNPHESYGYKYCIEFTNVLMPKLTWAGQNWLKGARLNLQNYMEKGLVHKSYISIYNKSYNINNRLTRSDGKTLRDKTGKEMKTFYTNIELYNTKFQSFAFATHPDAYDPYKMSFLPAQDLIRILLTPDMKEWIGAETWEQAWIMAKNMDYGSVTKSTWQELKNDTKEVLEKAEGKLKKTARELKNYWDELFK